MTNCEYYYSIVNRYRLKLGEINAKFDKQIQAKEGYRGSAGYQADIQKIEQERTAEIAELRTNCRESFDNCIKSMEMNAKERPMTPPTPEALAILQTLQMREHLTREDLEHAAHATQDCAVALGVLEELGRKHEIMGFHAVGSDISDIAAENAIRAFARNAQVLLTLDRCGNRGAQLDFSGGPNGNTPSSASIDKFRIDIDPKGPADCASIFGNVPVDTYAAFCKAVDGAV